MRNIPNMVKRKDFIVTHKVVSREDPNIVLGTNPKDFPALANKCAAAIKTMETGKLYRVVK
jgi:hypothetical protein